MQASDDLEIRKREMLTLVYVTKGVQAWPTPFECTKQVLTSHIHPSMDSHISNTIGRTMCEHNIDLWEGRYRVRRLEFVDG